MAALQQLVFWLALHYFKNKVKSKRAPGFFWKPGLISEEKFISIVVQRDRRGIKRLRRALCDWQWISMCLQSLLWPRTAGKMRRWNASPHVVKSNTSHHGIQEESHLGLRPEQRRVTDTHATSGYEHRMNWRMSRKETHALPNAVHLGNRHPAHQSVQKFISHHLWLQFIDDWVFSWFDFFIIIWFIIWLFFIYHTILFINW